MIFFLQYQKGELSREEATDKIFHCALKLRRQLFKHGDDDDDDDNDNAPTVAQQAQTPTVAQQADMYNLRTTVERKPTQEFTPSIYNQQKTKKKNKSGSEKRRRSKLGKQKVTRKMKIKYKLWHH